MQPPSLPAGNTATHTPGVSVVVPVYKVEKYLRQCVDSILAQTLTDIEVILVDDGSPDACPAMVDEYAAKDARVVAIHQPNGGYGKAVNTGVAAARAPYIGIIESDDWIEPTMYEKLLHRAEETGADVVKCMFWKYDSTAASGNQNELYTCRVGFLADAPDCPFRPIDWEPIFAHHASLWSNLYSADLLRQISFIESPGAAYQDFPFIMEVLARAEKMSIVKEALVHYRMEAGQNSSSTRNDAGLLRMPEMTIQAYEVLVRHGIIDKVKEAFFFHAYLANFGFLLRISDENRPAYLSKARLIFAHINEFPDFSWKYFKKGNKKKTLRLLKADSFSDIRSRWKLKFKKGLLTLRIFGRDYQWQLWK